MIKRMISESVVVTFFLKLFGYIIEVYKNSFLNKLLCKLEKMLVSSAKTSVMLGCVAGNSSVQKYWEGSFFFDFLQRIADFFYNLFKTFSNNFRSRCEKSLFKEVTSKSLLIKWSMLFAVVGVVLCAVSFAAGVKFALVALAGFLMILFTLRFFNISLFLFILFMGLVPHDYWNNIYSVLASCFYLTFFMFKKVNEEGEFRLKGIDVSFILFVLTVFVGTFTAILPKEAVRVLLFFIASFAFSCMIASTVKTKEALKGLLGVMYAAVIATSIYAIYQNITGVEVDPSLTDLALNSNMPGRAFSTLSNPNNFAEYLILLLPFLAAFALSFKNIPTKISLFALLAVPVFALFVTYARSGYIALAIVIVVMIGFYNWKLIPLIILGGILVFPFLPSTVTERALTIGNLQDTSSSFRFYIWSGTINMLRDYFWTGIGGGDIAFSSIYPNYADPYASTAIHSHMLYLQIWVEFGFLSVVCFLWYMIRSVKQGIISFNKNRKSLAGIVSVSAIAAICGIAFMGIVEYVWFYPRIMLTFFIVMGTLSAAVKINRMTLLK